MYSDSQVLFKDHHGHRVAHKPGTLEVVNADEEK